MGRKICGRCGDTFYAEESWKRVCFPCWKAEKNGERRAHEKIRDLKAEVFALRRQLSQQTGSLPPDLLAKMIRLCHPDRHGGKHSAHEVTQWLLEQRKS